MLLNRAKDLAVGGKLALFNFGIDEEGRYLGATGGVNMFDTFSEIWAEFVTTASLRQRNTGIPTFRSPTVRWNSSLRRSAGRQFGLQGRAPYGAC